MKAVVYPGGGAPLVLETLPDPVPGPDDLLVAVRRCGICGTDLSMTKGGGLSFPAGCVPGHEYAGEVVEVGASVDGFAKGDRVTALPSTGCGRCAACRRGNFILCRNAPGVMGGFAELIRIPASVAVKLPQTLSFADGALIEPLAVGSYGVRESAMKPGERVLVLGGGTVALCAIWWARRRGAGRIAALSRSSRRRAMLEQMGADAFVTQGEGDAAAVVEALGGPPTVVFECVGEPGLIGQGLRHVGVFGEVVSLGFCTAPDPFVPAMAAMKGAALKFPVGYTLYDFEEAAREMDRGHADPKALVTSVVSLDETPATFDRLRGANAETKVHVAPR